MHMLLVCDVTDALQCMRWNTFCIFDGHSCISQEIIHASFRNHITQLAARNCNGNQYAIAFMSDIKNLRCRASAHLCIRSLPRLCRLEASFPTLCTHRKSYTTPCGGTSTENQHLLAHHRPHASVGSRLCRLDSKLLLWTHPCAAWCDCLALAAAFPVVNAQVFVLSRGRQLMRHAPAAGLQRRCEGRVCQREGGQGVDCNVARQAAAF